MNIKSGDVIKFNTDYFDHEFTITSIEYDYDMGVVKNTYKLNLINSNYYCIFYPKFYPESPAVAVFGVKPIGALLFTNTSEKYSLDKVTINGIPIMKYLNGD